MDKEDQDGGAYPDGPKGRKMNSVSAPYCPHCGARLVRQEDNSWRCTCPASTGTCEVEIEEQPQTRSERVQVTVTPDEEARIQAAAKERSKTKSSWIRDVVLDRLEEIGA